MVAEKTISAVIVNYNAGACLIDCIASVVSQTDQVLVVDNASSDDSIAAAREKFAANPNVQFVLNENNVGFAAGCNCGIAASTSAYVFFLNPDGVADDGAVEILRDALDSSEDIGMTGGLLLNPDNTEQAGGRRLMPRPWNSIVRGFGLGWLARKYPERFPDYNLHEQPLPEKPVEVEAISGACMMIKRSTIEKIGGWDEGYFLHCEDLDWCMRIGLAGLKILFVPEAKIHHALSVCSRDRKLFVEWHKHKGMIRFYRKFYRKKYPVSLFALIFMAVWARFGLLCGKQFVRRIFSRGSHE